MHEVIQDCQSPVCTLYAELKLYIVVFSYPGDQQKSMSDAKLLKECRLPILVTTVMSLIRTDYVPEWRISAHAQSVLAAGQKHHSDCTVLMLECYLAITL